jgi:two-component system sensor histidine kinase CpxA
MKWISAVRRAFNLWLLLGTFFCAGTGLVVLNTVLMLNFARDDLTNVCAAARSAYEEGGPYALRLFFRGIAAGRHIPVSILDEEGRDLATGQHKPAAPIRHAFGLPPAAPLASVVTSSHRYSCVADPPTSLPPLPLGPMSWVLPFVSILCCSVGAYVSWRMRRIETVIRHFGSGALTVRVSSDSRDAIGRLARAFNQMAERIESLVASHQTLCADMAHELRSPLTRLVLAVRGARNGTAGSLNQLEREASRINDLADQLLEVARSEVDANSLELESLDLESMLTEIADHCRIEAEERGCEIELGLADPGHVNADAELLRRAIENVLRNAINHTPEGTRIKLIGSADHKAALISIRDWGPGVPDGALSNIFRPFYKVDPSRARNNGGVGLGLSIAQRAIAVHGGTIVAENSGPGLRVVIRIPRK